jgi:hypothetical protein
LFIALRSRVAAKEFELHSDRTLFNEIQYVSCNRQKTLN